VEMDTWLLGYIRLRAFDKRHASRSARLGGWTLNGWSTEYRLKSAVRMVDTFARLREPCRAPH
jgi:hypothetical protein